MSYTLRKFDGTPFKVLSDGVIDARESSSLTLIGKDVSGYGVYQNDNFLHLLEHFAHDVPPSNPIQGQIWFDNSDNVKKPKVYDGSAWQNFLISSSSGSQPTNQQVGDLWFNTATQQLFVNTGTSYLLIGPPKVEGFQETSILPDTITDTSSTQHAALILYVDGTILGVMSDKEYFVDPADKVYAGGVEYVGYGLTFAREAEIVSTTTYATLEFDETIIGNWKFKNKINLETTTSSNILSTATFIVDDTTGDLSVLTYGNDFNIEATNILPIGTTLLGSQSKKFAKIFASEFNAGSSITSAGLVGQFELSNGSRIYPSADGVTPSGLSNARWSSVFTRALSAGSPAGTGTIVGQWEVTSNSSIKVQAGAVINATYADIAEKYVSDKMYSPGTVVMFGGEKEVTIASEKETHKVAGIVSEKPSHVLNVDAEGAVAIALVGRVPCQVVGNIKKGDLLVVSNIPGVATSSLTPHAGTILGKAMENYNSDEVGTIEVMVVRG